MAESREPSKEVIEGLLVCSLNKVEWNILPAKGDLISLNNLLFDFESMFIKIIIEEVIPKFGDCDGRT